MIQYNSKDAYLAVPKGLGNLGGNTGSGGGGDVSALSGSVITLSATTRNVINNVTQLSAATQQLQEQALSQIQQVSGSVETLTETVDSQGDSIADLLLDVDGLDTRVSANTEAVQALSGVTGDVASLSAQTSANTANIEALSAATEELSATTEYIYNEIFYEDESGETYSQINDLWDAVGEKQDVLEAGSGISIDSPNISVNIGPGLTFDNKGRNQVMAKLGDGMRFGSGDTISLNIGDGLAFSGDTLVASGGTGGGIEKVDELPATAEEGDVVWLNGQTGVTGYTVTAAGDNWASWPWELDRNYFNINNTEIRIRGSERIGKWTKTNDLFEGWGNYPGLIMRARRNSTDGGPVYDFIDPTGQYTITAGSDALSITTNTFSRRGSLYVYSGGKWYRKAEREILLSGSGQTVADLVHSIWCDIEDADYDNLVIRYAPDGKDLREFKIYTSASFGIDMQCSDDRGTGANWGRLLVKNFRMHLDGSLEDIVGDHWIVTEDQLPAPSQETIHITSTGDFSNPDEFGAFTAEVNNYKIWFFYDAGDGNWAQAPLKYIWRQYETVNDSTKLIYYWAVENLIINGTAYKGSWHSAEWEWSSYVKDSWTTM